MLKKIVIVGLIFLFVVSLTTPAHCDTAVKKLGRGISNIITCPLEIIEQVKNVNNSDGPMAAATYGVLKGLGMTVVRAGVGLYEAATFIFPFPKYYQPILKEPEFFLEEMNW